MVGLLVMVFSDILEILVKEIKLVILYLRASGLSLGSLGKLG